MQTLQSKGVCNLAMELAARNLPLVGRVEHFLSNWQMITHKWAIKATGLISHRLTQHRRPPQLTFTKEEEECMQAEIQGMLEKRPSPGEEKTPQTGAKEGWQAEIYYKPQEAKPVSEDRALQDGRHSHA